MFGKLPYILLFFLCLTTVTAKAGPDTDTIKYRSPVDIPILLSGTFGELRGSHFHSGIDIKTEGKEGLNIYAVADGYVSRVKVSARGYGKALYITHPNGETSVYAHLSKFNPDIEAFVKAKQYSKESFEIDEYLSPTELPFKKGDIVALSGNTGGSMGPHLHFEIRGPHPNQPDYGTFSITDNVRPHMQNLMVYALESPLGGKKKYTTWKGKKGEYSLDEDTIMVNSKSIGIGLAAYDQADGVSNKNGIYRLQLRVDGDVVYQFSMDEFSFSETRYIQAHTDYCTKIEDKLTVMLCYKLPGNRLSIYDQIVNSGYIELLNDRPKKVQIDISDYNNNVSSLEFYAVYDPAATTFKADKQEYEAVFLYDQSNKFSEEGLKIDFPSRAFYNNISFTYSTEPADPSNQIYSRKHLIHQDTEPVHKRFTLTIEPDSLPLDLVSKAVIAHEDRRGNLSTYTTQRLGKYLVAKPRNFGTFFVTVDTIPPTIKSVNIYEGKDMSNSTTIRMRISDDFSGIKSYRGTVDGKWILMEYDPKKRLLTYTFDEKVPEGEHTFKLYVTDDVNNKSVYKATFKR